MRRAATAARRWPRGSRQGAPSRASACSHRCRAHCRSRPPGRRRPCAPGSADLAGVGQPARCRGARNVLIAADVAELGLHRAAEAAGDLRRAARPARRCRRAPASSRPPSPRRHPLRTPPRSARGRRRGRAARTPAPPSARGAVQRRERAARRPARANEAAPISNTTPVSTLRGGGEHAVRGLEVIARERAERPTGAAALCRSSANAQ